MARIARVVIPGYPHHIIQRGNRRQDVFFSDKDKQAYLDLLELHAKPSGLEFWAYCLMDNHVHLVAVPDREESLALGIGEAHRRYTRMIHFREGWRGYLWEGRFKSYPLSEAHLYATMRYIERNPVRAGLVKKAEEYRWSSAKAHVHKKKDKILSDNFVLSEIRDWREYLADEDKAKDINLFKKHMNTGRPLGDDKFIEEVSNIIKRDLIKKKPGPKKKR